MRKDTLVKEVPILGLDPGQAHRCNEHGYISFL